MIKIVLFLFFMNTFTFNYALVADGGLCSFYDRTPVGHSCSGELEFWNRNGIVR